MVDQVTRDQEVRREAHVVNDLEFKGQALDRLIGQLLSPSLVRSFEGQVLEVFVVGVKTFRQREFGELWLAHLDLDVAAFGDPQRVVARTWNLAEQIPHLGRRLYVVVVAFELKPVGIAHKRCGLHTQQSVVGLVIVGVGVVGVVGRYQWRTQVVRNLDQLGVRLALRCNAVILDLNKHIVTAEDVLQLACFTAGACFVAVEQRLQYVSAQTAGGSDNTFAVLVQEIPVDPRFVVVPLEVGPARELDQVLVALLVLSQQAQVVIQLARIGLATRVVEPAATLWAFAAMVVGHVGLGADNRLDPSTLTRLVEVQNAIHVAVVGHRHRWLTVGGGRCG